MTDYTTFESAKIGDMVYSLSREKWGVIEKIDLSENIFEGVKSYNSFPLKVRFASSSYLPEQYNYEGFEIFNKKRDLFWDIPEVIIIPPRRKGS